MNGAPDQTTASGHRGAANRTPPPRPADVLGAPFVPPAGVTRMVVLGRSLLARLYRASAPPPSRILEAALAGLEPAVLRALCHLDIPDRITRPVPVTELAARLDLDAGRLRRLLRFAHVQGWIRLDRRGNVRPTRCTAFLRRDHPGGWRAWATFAGGSEVTAALGHLASAIGVEGDAFCSAHQQSFFAWAAGHPDARARFDAAMAAGGRMHGLLLARALDWSDRRRVCDVGGGDGTLLATLVAHHPHLDSVVLELPEVVERMPGHPQVAGVAGNAFVAVPGGFDTYLLVNVLHDWGDGDARRILTRVAEAARTPCATPAPVRVVVVESRARRRSVDDLTLSADTLMLALTPGGRERTMDELTALGRAAGLQQRRRVALPSGDVAVVFESSGA